MSLRMTFTCAALAILCGCSGPRPSGDATAPGDWVDPELAAEEPLISARRSSVVRLGDGGQAAAPLDAWIPLEEWSRVNGFDARTPVAPDTRSGYKVSSRHGILMAWPKVQMVTWNGLDIRLGFAPKLVNGRLFIHRLDLEKSFYPLLATGEGAGGLPGRVVIDPGHGGDNLGTRSVVDGRPEKEFTLDWALRLRPLLEAQGWEVFLTRTNDVDLTLTERTAFAESVDADLFVSLHFNASPSRSDQAGVETYCITPVGLPSNLIRGGDDGPDTRYPGNAFDDANFLLAVRLHRTLVSGVGAHDRGVRRARVMGVLRWQKRPAVLVEAGYLSNPAEARRIADPEHRQQLAMAIARALGGGDAPASPADNPAGHRHNSMGR